VKRFLITGGAGFIGSNIARALLEKKLQVTVLDNFSTGSMLNLENVPNERLLKVIHGDVCDLSVLKDAMEGVDAVFHEAALVSVPESLANPDLSFSNNAKGSFNVFEAARQMGVNKIVYASSAAVYGEKKQMPINESFSSEPLSPYALDKTYLEGLAKVYWSAYGISSVGLRYFNVFGEGQDPTSPYSGVISKFVDCCVSGNAPVIYGDGLQSRDFVYVDDVVDANIRSMNSDHKGAFIYNIGSGVSSSINDLFEVIRCLSGFDVECKYAASRDGEIYTSVANVDLALKELGWKAKISLKEGLQFMLSTMHEKGEALTSKQGGFSK